VLIAPYVNGVTPSYSYFESEGIALVSVTPESWSAAVGNPGQGLKSRSVNLKEATSVAFPMAGQTRMFDCIQTENRQVHKSKYRCTKYYRQEVLNLPSIISKL